MDVAKGYIGYDQYCPFLNDRSKIEPVSAGKQEIEAKYCSWVSRVFLAESLLLSAGRGCNHIITSASKLEEMRYIARSLPAGSHTSHYYLQLVPLCRGCSHLPFPWVPVSQGWQHGPLRSLSTWHLPSFQFLRGPPTVTQGFLRWKWELLIQQQIDHLEPTP